MASSPQAITSERLARTATILDEIIAAKRLEVDAARRAVPERQLRERVPAEAPRPFAKGLAGPGLAVIAEVKRASPSAGVFAPGLEAAATARAYEGGGAAALSVLTDGPYFHGSADDLRLARAAVSLPVLRKEFIISEYQIVESRAMGADAILLIAAVVTNLRDLIAAARALDLECLVEIHNESELDRALMAGAMVIGINNRDLRSFVTDLNVTRRLRPLIPPGKLVVSESGIKGPEDAKKLRDWGADAILVGESVATAADQGSAVRALVEAGRG